MILSGGNCKKKKKKDYCEHSILFCLSQELGAGCQSLMASFTVRAETLKIL